MATTIRWLMLIIAAAQGLMAIAFAFQLPLAIAIWPYPGTTPLTFIFVASIFAAAAASTLWAAGAKQYGALAGIGLDYLMILIPVGIFTLQLYAATGNQALLPFGAFSLISGLLGGALMLWSLRMPLDRTPALPPLVRWSFAGFITALIIVSALLLMRTPNVIPWSITPDLSVVIGWMFLGAMTYFAYALVRPSWLNAAGPLAGFLAYDVVLLVPFLQRLPSVAPEHRLGQWIYLAVVIYSGALAIYYLFIHRPTQIWQR